MLKLDTGMETIDGITVFPDHADPAQFWYLPGPVTLSRRADGRANFSFIKFKPAAVAGGAKGGGFLAFGVCLKLDPKTEAKIRSKLGVGGEVRLSAAPFDQGNVRAMALDLQGEGGTVATEASAASIRAVEQILGATVPSLFGDNDAIFSLVLSQEGAIILEQALEQGATPIGVIYELKFTAMQPALDIEIKIDFERVYKHFSVGIGADVYFVKADIEAGMESLRQSGAIEINITNFTTGDEQKERENWAIKFLTDNLLSDWFHPTLTPGQLQGGMAGVIPPVKKAPGSPTTPTPQPGGVPVGGNPAVPATGGAARPAGGPAAPAPGGAPRPAGGPAAPAGGTPAPAPGKEK